MAGTSGRSGGNRTQKIDTFPMDGLPDAPERRTEAFYAYWEFFIRALPAHALRKIDQIQMSILCEQLVEIDQLSRLIAADPSDLKSRSLRLRICQQVSRLSAQFGMSPADRQRLSLEPVTDDDDPFNELLARLKPTSRN